mgnify:CR=1 FL=1
MMQITTHSADETQALGQKLASRLAPGDVIAYFGDLGAGKTAFTRGLAQGLGITDPVTSPTYTIVNEYLSGRIPLFHFDMYRLSSSDELFDIGWEDYLQRGGVCAVHCGQMAFYHPIVERDGGTIREACARIMEAVLEGKLKEKEGI